MKKNDYHVKAKVTVEVEMCVVAESRNDAKRIVDDHIIMTAILIDVPSKEYDVYEDTISDVDYRGIEPIS